jgi:tRNA pseudouridine13 synthase
MSDEPLLPHEPEPCTADLPAVGGRLGPSPDDFVVDEIAAFELSGEGEHVYARIRKRQLTTQQLLAAVARAADVRPRDIGYAGMKDKWAVTSQWVSLPARSSDPASWSLPDGVEVLECSRHNKKLRTGQLRGNRFRVRIVDLEPDALARARAVCERIRVEGLPNYFGEQRFGRGGSNLAAALTWLRQGGTGLRGGSAHLLRKLYPSVIQSEVFNRYLTARRRLGLGRLLQGEGVRLDGSASMFSVEDPERELPRLAVRDIHATGPLPGPRGLCATGAARKLELDVEAELGLSDDDLRVLGEHAPGTRRDLLIRPAELDVESHADGGLPPGSFATQLLRELTRSPWLEARRDRLSSE